MRSYRVTGPNGQIIEIQATDLYSARDAIVAEKGTGWLRFIEPAS